MRFGYDIARSSTIAIGPENDIHLPDENCTDACQRWYKSLPGRPVDADGHFIMIVDCEKEQHRRSYTNGDYIDMCSDCYIATFLPESEMVYVIASERERELEMVNEVSAQKWTPFSEGDATAMTNGNQNVTVSVLVDDTDDALILLTPSMLRLLVSGRLNVVLIKREEPQE